MAYTTLLLDLDDTVYPPSTGIWDLIGVRINLFIQEKLGFPVTQVSTLRESLFHKYGTTLRGLQLEYNIDPIEYLDFVHQVPIEDLVSPDPRLQQQLAGFAIPKWIFTNASRQHALRVMHRLRIETTITGIIDILDISPYCKPMPEAFTLAVEKSGALSPGECILVDDSPRNLTTARQMGMFTIQVGNQPHLDAHEQIETIHDLPSVLPALEGAST